MMQLRRNFSFKAAGKFLSLAPVFAMALVVPCANAQVVETIPWDEANPTAPHTAIANTVITLGGIFIPAAGKTGDSYTYTWNFGDGSPAVGPTAVPAINGGSYDLPASHTYSGATFGVTTWQAQVQVNDVTAGNAQVATGTYYVIWEDGTLLQPRVNVAIDWGLWHLHESQYRNGTTQSYGPGQWTYNCGPSATSNACANDYPSLTATNVQAFEVSGHLPPPAAGSATDPYATDVAQGLDWIVGFISASGAPYNTQKPYGFDPATATYGCKDGTPPTTSDPTCSTKGGQLFYNAGATTCPGATISSPCYYNFSANPSHLGFYNNTSFGAGEDAGYEQGMFMDAIIASGNPGYVVPATNSIGVANPAGVAGQTYLNIIKGYVDYISYCQYGYDYDVSLGYTRGGNSSQGGAWLYGCQGGDDNSTSQWESIGLISAERGFGVPIQPIVTDANQTWTTNAEDVVGTKPTGPNPWNAGADYGGFGYRGSLSYSEAWGPFATTPSGMVQMSLDGVGRTRNTAFGDSTTDADQRFNNVETWYADNFCNATSSGAGAAPKAYTYGLFSFTKSMLLHNPGGSLTPIQYLRTQTPNVFGPTTATNVIDWYAAVGPGHPYSGANPAKCDGVAETLVDRQYTPSSPVNPYTGATPGFWTGDNYDGEAAQYETAWSLIMLQKTVFVTCVNNLGGLGTKGNGLSPARVDLTWTGIPNVTGYNIFVSTTNGGPYTQVTYNGGTTTGVAFSDRSGLVNGQTYYFVLKPVNATGTVCVSNQATVFVP
jgi:hypothetical protein